MLARSQAKGDAVSGDKILLTGGAGYIGSHTAVALAEAGYAPVVLDNFSNAKPSVLERLEMILGVPVALERGDILDRAFLADVFTRHEFGAVIHFAARKAVGESVARPMDYFETNCCGLTALLRTMEASGVRNLVFSSSATVYGEPDVFPVPETAPRWHTSPYAMTKLASEDLLLAMADADPFWAFGILRYFNPAGAHESGLIGEEPDGIPNNLMPYLAKVALGELPHLNVFGDDFPTPDGTGVRDFVHVMDLAEAHVSSLRTLLDGSGGHAVNIGTGEGSSVMQMLASYGRACGRDLPWKPGPRRAGDVAKLVADPSLAASVLKFRTRRTLDEMCESSWRWVTRNSS